MKSSMSHVAGEDAGVTGARQHVCIIGLGYVGITLAVAMANAGFAIDGVERNPLVLKALRGGLANVHEDGLGESLAQHLAEGRIRLHESVPRGSSNSVYIVTVGTPVREDTRVDLDSVGRAMADVAVVLKDGDLVTCEIEGIGRLVNPVAEVGAAGRVA